MSKESIRKGLALGTALSFGLVGLSAMPATADSTGRVTLVPDSGETFNSTIYDGFTFDSAIDGDLDYNSQFLTYKISNPNKESLSVDVNNSASSNFSVYTMKNGSLISADPSTTVEGGLDPDTYYYDDATLFVQVYDAYTEDGGWVDGLGETITSQDVSVYNEFNVVTDESHTVSFTTQAWLDINENGVVDEDEKSLSTDAEAVSLYDPSEVTASVKLSPWDLQLGENDLVDFEISFNKALNVDQIDYSDWGVALYKNGQDVELDSPSELSTNADSILAADIEAADDYDNTLGTIDGTLDMDLDMSVGNWSARVAYMGVSYNDTNDDEDFFWAGSRSAAFSVAEGTNSDVDGVLLSASSSANAYESDEDFYLRSGTKAITYTAQAVESDLDAVEASNVRFLVNVWYDNEVEGSKLTVSGSTTTLTSDSGEIVVYGRADADGKFNFTVTSSTASDEESYYVDVYYLTTNGTWDLYQTTEDDGSLNEEDGAYVEYEDAYVSDFAFTNNVLAGSTVNANFTVEDQFGEPVSTDNGAALKVYLTDGADLEKTVNVTSGKASISFANYLTKGDVATLDANLFTGNDETDSILEDTAELYNPEATGAVIVDAEATGNITQDAFILGKEDADAEIVAPNDNTISFTGIIEDTNGAGLPAAVVTISGSGLQFEDQGDAVVNYTKDSVTVVAESDGSFDVNVWSHKVGDTVITVTSGGKSAKTTLTTEFSRLTADDLKVTWNAPKHPAVNGLYAVTLKVTDTWNNAIEGADVTISTDGALQVNGDDTKDKTTNAAGKATVYVGGVKDLKGFGSVTAVITDVAIDVDGDDTYDAADTDLTDPEGDYTSITQEVLVGVSASAVASVKKGQLNVSAWNTKGKSLQVYVGGKLKATKTTVAGVDKVYVKGLSTGSKLVTIKVGGSTYFSENVSVK